jgi:hypothetical protein
LKIAAIADAIVLSARADGIGENPQSGAAEHASCPPVGHSGG